MVLRSPKRAGAVVSLALLPALHGCAQEVLLSDAPSNEPRAYASVERAPTRPTHPEMQPQAIDRAARNFDRCIGSLGIQAARRGIARDRFDALTRGIEPDLSIMEKLDRQPEFSKPVWEYLETLVSEQRIATGREMMAKHAGALEAVERRFGVDRYIIAAIWGVESNFGATMGERPVLRSTATLACIGRRQRYFRDEFLGALEILVRGDIPAAQFNGSWAGAFGQTQFMPTSFKRHAVDFDGDRRRDIVSSAADAFASTANMLAKSGWRTGESWGYEVALPRGFNYRLADRSVQKSVREWRSLGVHRVADQSFPHANARASLVLPAGAKGPAFLVTENFGAIMKYNPSEAYALAVGHLADRMRGGGGFVRSWPRSEEPLSRSERFEMQERLAVLGHYEGEPDGQFGPETLMAIREFQASAGLVPDGFASSTVLQRVRQMR
jgi:lytic murein transglycosylase